MIRRPCAILLALAVTLIASAPSAAAEPVDPQQLVLRPSDLRGGYNVERNELHEPCDTLIGVGPETPVFLRLWTRLQPVGCEVHMSRLWRLPGQEPAPREVSSLTLTFSDARGAEEMLDHPRDLTQFAFGLDRREVELSEAAPTIGDAAVMLEARRSSSAVVIWRSGALLGAVAVTDRAHPSETAAGLAAVQQARMTSPQPLPPDAFDDLEVPLDDPGLAGPVYWLGPMLPSAGTFPRLPLIWVEQPSPAQARQGLRVTLHYGWNAAAATVSLLLTDPALLRQRTVRRELQSLQSARCTAAARVTIPGGHAKIFTRRPRCPSHGDELALVWLPGVRIYVFPNSCLDCRGPIDRYRSPAGLRRLVRALRVREMPAP